MPIHVLRDKATVEQVRDMLAEHTVMIKVIESESLINIRPRLGNRSIILQNPELCAKVEAVTRAVLGEVS